MINRSYQHSGSRAAMTGTILLVAGGLLASVSVAQFAGAKRAEAARHLNNVRQIKFACDGFATDFDGQYPNDDTGNQLQQGLGTDSSNDYFRQLFLSGETQSELIFWVKGATTCTKAKADDIIMRNGNLLPDEILKPGDCGWAYLREQTNTSNVARPLIVIGYKDGTKEFDLELHGGRVIVVRIDGSAKAMEPDAKGVVLDGSGNDIFSPKADAWEGSGENPARLLVQPATPLSEDEAAKRLLEKYK